MFLNYDWWFISLKKIDAHESALIAPSMRVGERTTLRRSREEAAVVGNVELEPLFHKCNLSLAQEANIFRMVSFDKFILISFII